MIVDTFLRTLSIPPDKKAKLAAFLETFFDLRECSLHDLASLRGRIQHYSACIPYILPFVALISSVIGTEDKPDYDRMVALPPAITEATTFIRGVLEDYAFRGRPLWPFVPSTLYAAFLAGETGSARIVTVTWDASLHGWGMVLRWWANRDGKVIVGTLPDSDDMRHQVRRETLAGVLSIEAASREVDLRDAVVILRNDAVGALSALRKGSFKSTFLQQCAMRTCRLEHSLGCNTLHLHAPGRVLIEEGVDDLSRDRAIEVAGPVSGPLLRQKALQLAKSLGWRLTVDSFASESNSLLPRFFARYAEPSAEAEDAFTVGDWDQSVCPACGLLHRETLFAYPPPPCSTASSPRHEPTALAPSLSPHWPSRPPTGQSSCEPPWSTTGRPTSAFATNKTAPPAPTPRASLPSSPSTSRPTPPAHARRNPRHLAAGRPTSEDDLPPAPLTIKLSDAASTTSSRPPTSPCAQLCLDPVPPGKQYRTSHRRLRYYVRHRMVLAYVFVDIDVRYRIIPT